MEKNALMYINTVKNAIAIRMKELQKKRERKKYFRRNEAIERIASMPVTPVSRDFGLSRGRSIGRVYVEHFLKENRRYIRGDVLEIAENTYTMKYGKGRVANSYILHVCGWGGVKGNLETGEGIEENRYDAAIITQTLMFTYDIRRVAENIYKLLKKNGTALITVSGIVQVSRYDADRWGHFYNFHEDAMRKLFVPLFGEKNVVINSYGNVKTAAAMLYGLCYEELEDADFMVNDKDYPVIISVLLHKR